MNTDNQKKYLWINRIVIGISFIVRLIYVFITDVGTRQHDLGCSTSLTDNIINPGHLGYVEYLVKFRHLPDFDPFTVFSYYHPPLHHIVAAFFLNAAHLLGIKEPAVYESIQIPTYIYGCLTVLITYYTLRLLCKEEKKLTLPLILVSLHPGLIYMTGSINNDMMGTMFSFLCIYLSIVWIQKDYQFKYLVYMALSIGFGIIAKANVAILALPMAIIMLMHFIDAIKASKALECFKQYIIFAIISIPIGLSWSIRTFVLFGETPGIPSPGPQQCVSPYPYSEIFGLPEKLAITYPFHAENAIYCHNAWQIMFKTSLFTEIWPTDISRGLLLFCQIVYGLAVTAGLICAVLSIVKPILLIKKGDKAIGALLLSGYITMVITFIFFVIKYPYTCSADFRYIGTSLLFAGLSLLPVKESTKK